ncbi:MAG: hypothetical protein J7576_23375, partial [Siphonobacter aquaeclarae]|nr:hypothetical protein [Siphonobacter aquaeclarae]
ETGRYDKVAQGVVSFGAGAVASGVTLAFFPESPSTAATVGYVTANGVNSGIDFTRSWIRNMDPYNPSGFSFVDKINSAFDSVNKRP